MGAPDTVVVGVPGGGHRGRPPGGGGRGDGQGRAVPGRAVAAVAQGAVGVLQYGVHADRAAHGGGEPVQRGGGHQVLLEPQWAGVRPGGQWLEGAGVLGDPGLRGADQGGGCGESQRGPGQDRTQGRAPSAPAVSAAMLHLVPSVRAPSPPARPFGSLAHRSGPTAPGAPRVDGEADGEARSDATAVRGGAGPRPRNDLEPTRTGQLVHPWASPMSTGAAGHGGRRAAAPRPPRPRRNDTAGVAEDPRGTVEFWTFLPLRSRSWRDPRTGPRRGPPPRARSGARRADTATPHAGD